MKLVHEEKPSVIRYIFEFLFYFSIISTNFTNIIPLYKIPYALGAIVMFLGFLGFILLVTSGKKMPVTFWVILLINIPVAFTQFIRQGELPLIGVGSVNYFHWLSFFLAMYYLVQEESCARRILFFFSFLIVTSVALGGTLFYDDRLSLADGVGIAFQNANRIAHMSALFSIAAVFYSLKCRIIFKPLYWLSALALIAVLLKTVSRGGLLAFLCGLLMLVFLILLGRGVRLAGILIVAIFAFMLIAAGAFISQHMYAFSERAILDTGRTHVYNPDTLSQMFVENPIIGSGSGTPVESVGITAHNSYIYTFICFGGLAATLYLIWLFILGIRTIRMLFSQELPLHTRMMVVMLFGVPLVAQLLSNQGYLFYSTIFATAIIEKYTSAFSKKQIRLREFLRQDLVYECVEYDSQPPIQEEYYAN